MSNTKIKIVFSSITLLITTICTIIALMTSIETTTLKIVGSFASVFAISIVAWKFPKRFYCFAMIFDIFATSFGSVINLYATVNFYDRFVHYLSGILLFEAGIIIITYLMKKNNLKNAPSIKLIFSFFFSAACAGFWEIYEFTADNLINANMQGDNINTMGDIVSGVLGALTAIIIYEIILKRNKSTHSDKI